MNTKEKAMSNFDQIDPRVCVNGKLRKLHRILNQAYQRQIKPFGLRGSMLSILFIIGKRKGVNQKTIAETLILDQSTMSRDLKRLMGEGWVQASLGEDARNKQLELTDAGYALLEEIVPVWQKLQSKVEQILGDFNISQIDGLIAALQTCQDDL